MTRLCSEDITEVSKALAVHDADLVERTGKSLAGIGCRAAGVDMAAFQTATESITVAVVPVASGQGMIEGFSQTVCDIVSHLGFKAFVTASR